MIDKLYNLKLIDFSKADELCQTVVCCTKNKQCMLRQCHECNSKTVPTRLGENTVDDIVTFSQWKSRSETRVIKGKDVEVKLMDKCNVNITKAGLVDRLNASVPEFLVHVFNIRQQFAALKSKKESLHPSEVIIHCDFSENVVFKYHEEVQAMHFGASKRQMSMHTSVMYLHCTLSKKNFQTVPAKQTTCLPFCTISAVLDHGVHGIWAHLRPLIICLRDAYPSVSTIHFWSDGPTSQYRNRGNMFMITSMLSLINPNIKSATWNFSEAGHGKGAMDGIGAVLKRTADRLVSQQRDITTVEQFLEEVSPACPGVRLYEIPDQHFQQIQEWMPKTIPSVPSIMKMHQVVWSERQKSHLFLRELSCFECLEVCSHHCLNKGVIQTLSSTSVSPFLGCILYFI